MRISLNLGDDDDDNDDDDNNADDKDNNDDKDDDDDNNLDLIPGSSLQEGGETEEDDLWTTWGKVRTMVMKMAMVIVVMTIMTITILTTMKILLEDDL